MKKKSFEFFHQGVIRLIDKAMKGTDNSVRGGMANEIHKHMDLVPKFKKTFLSFVTDAAAERATVSVQGPVL
jgi:hypothetical protein